MMKKGLWLLLVLGLLLSALSVSANHITVTTEGFPANWVAENQSVKITVDNSLNQIQSMTVNGVDVLPSAGPAYYLLKQVDFDANTNVLTMGVFLGNQTANGGQFAFTYDAQKVTPATTIVNDFYVGSNGITLIKKAPTETRAGSGYLDTVRGNGYVTWVVSSGASVGGAGQEIELLQIAFVLNDGVQLSDLNAATFGTPAVSELNRPSMNEAACLAIRGTAITTDFKKAVLFNNNIYGDKIYSDFVFEGQTNGTTPFEVVVTDKNNNVKNEIFPVKVDLTKTLDNPTFDVSVHNAKITVSNVACTTNAPSGVTFTAELYVNGEKQVDAVVIEGGAAFTAPEGVTATVKVIATSGVGVTSNAQKNIFVPMIDRIGPEITVSGLPETEWTNQNVIFTVSATDPSGVKSVKVDGAAYTEAVTVTESKTITVVAEDNEGNSSEIQVSVKIDKQSPEASVSVQDTWGKTNTISVDATDALSGVKEILIDGQAGNTLSVDQNGVYPVKVIDNAGNVYTAVATVEKVDTDAPNVTVNVSENWAKTNVISVLATDTLSGVKEILINGEATDTLTVNQNGDYSVTVTDNAGNIFETVAIVSKVDTTVPAVTVSVTEGWVKQASLTVVATDAQSGVKEILINGEEQTTITVTENGDVTVQVTDHAGNIYEDTITVSNVDTELPIITVDELPDGDVKEFNMTFIANDALSGVATVKVNGDIVTDDGNGVYSILVNQNTDYVITVLDAAGNMQTETVTVDFLDLEAPFVAVSASTTVWTNQTVTLSITAEQSDIYINDVLIAENATSATKVVTENGTYIIKAVDAAGNEGSASYTVENIDHILPVADITVQDTWGKTNWVSVSAIDSQSGVKEILLNGEVREAVTVSENGTVTLKITDNAGNIYEETVSVTMVDNVNPSIDVTEPNNTPCKQFVFAISVSDGQSGVDKVYVNGNPVDGDEFTATQNGVYTFKAVDKVGNETSVVRELTSIDDVIPQVNLVSGNPESWTKGSAQISLAFSEQVTDVQVDGVAITESTFVAEQNKTYIITFADIAGNPGSYAVTVTYLDNTAPEISASVQDTWGKTNLISVSATDSGAGVKEIRINGEVCDSLAVNQNGVYTVSVTDYVGNVATETVMVSKVDTTAPEVQISVSDIWNTTNAVTVEVNDSQSGVASVLVNGSVVNPQNGAYVYTATQNGEVTIVVTDNADNSFETTATVSKVDTEAPELTLSDVPDAWCKSHTFTISATDSLSGLKEITVNGEILSGNEFTATQKGEYVFKATDNAGNQITVIRNVDKIDTAVPVFNGEITVSSVSETTFTLQMPSATDESGVSYAVKVNGEVKAYDGSGTFTCTGLTMSVDYAVELTATDGAGNTVTLSKTVKTAGLGGVKIVVTLKDISTSATALNMTVTVGDKKITLDNTGVALFEGLSAGTYTVKTEGAGYLAAEKTVTVENGKTTEVNLVVGTDFLPGDVNGDKKINIYDFNIIGSYYGDAADNAVKQACDLNRDGNVDGKDAVMFRKSFNK
ncbi:MAG: hypothetical protein IKJ55_07205 [Clostridia bacterium]|nr:hypothetical protein [Clostridia bacterium]